MSKHPYPHLVVRIYSGVYQREEIDIHAGPADARIGYRSSYLHHPHPFTEAGGLNPDCRDLLVAATIEAVRRTGFRMCLVWGPEDCTYCEKDGRAIDSGSPPSGGLGTAGARPLPGGIEVRFDRRERRDGLSVSPAVPSTDDPAP